MIEKRITFYCRPDGLPSYLATQLRQLAGHFSSYIALLNLTRLLKANASHPLAVLALGSRPGDLCQILIEGLDAELAHMVLTDFVSEHFSPVIRSKNAKFSHVPAIGRVDPGFALCFPPGNILVLSEAIDKADAITRLVALMIDSGAINDPQQLLDAINRREAISATAMGRGIAMPHTITEAVSEPVITVLALSDETDWGSALGPVTRAILVALPKPPEKAMFRGLTGLTRSLLNEDFCCAIRQATYPQVIHALILCGVRYTG